MLLPVREQPDSVSRDALRHRLVVTPTVERNLEAAALALCQGRPLLLEGPSGVLHSSQRPEANTEPAPMPIQLCIDVVTSQPPRLRIQAAVCADKQTPMHRQVLADQMLVPAGSGKSALVNELASRTGNADYITVHVDDQMDSKTLLGAYIATTTPGEFTWQPGLLTQVCSCTYSTPYQTSCRLFGLQRCIGQPPATHRSILLAALLSAYVVYGQTTMNALATSTCPIRLKCAAQAVTRGKWLVIEDVNMAPPDVLAALVPLLESRELHLSQRAQTIPAAPGFQLLATVTCSPG